MPRLNRYNKKRTEITKLSKICPKCRIKKNGIEFGWQYYGKKYLRSQCKSCRAEAMREYRKNEEFKQKHRDYMREYMRKYRKRSH